MKSKTLIIVLILVIFVLPSTLAQFQVSKTNTIIDNPPQFNDFNHTVVKFCWGQISDLWEIGCGYAIVGYAFNAEDVICIIDYWDRPLFRHLNEGEELAIYYDPIIKGTISDNHICASSGILSPKIFILIYLIFS